MKERLLVSSEKKLAKSWGNVLVSQMDVEAHLSQRYTFLFVWTGEKHYYSRLGCVIVTFDQQSYELKCNCNHGKQLPS